MKFPEFKNSYLQGESDTLYVINFWATWCKPCIEEMPYFLEAEKEFSAKKFKLVLASLDFSSNLEKRVIPFLKKKGIESEVILIDDIDYDSWIDQVSDKWSGAIPATLFLNHQKGINSFKEGEFDKESLFTKINNYL